MTGLRERKKAERRERILACGAQMFSDRGFDVTTMEAIAACADISPATLYNFFPTKLDMLTELFGRQIEERLAESRFGETGSNSNAVEAVYALVTVMFQAFAGFDKGLLRRVTLNALNEGPARDAGARYVLAESDMLEEVVALLRRCQDKGTLARDLPVGDLAAAIFACGNGEYYAWLGDDDARIETALARVRRHIEVILNASSAKSDGPKSKGNRA